MPAAPSVKFIFHPNCVSQILLSSVRLFSRCAALGQAVTKSPWLAAKRQETASSVRGSRGGLFHPAPRAAFLLIFSLILFALSPVTCTLLDAQTENSTLSGVILDPNGAVVPDVEVTAIRIETNTTVTTKTNDAGIYVLPGLVPGHYHLQIRKPGFKEIALETFELYVQDKLQQNFTLEIGSVSESVTVSAGGINVNTTDASVGTVVDQKFVESIPLNGQSFQTLISLAPGVTAVPGGRTGSNGEFSINGQRAESNYFTVDGVSVNTGAAPLAGLNSAGLGGAVPSETAVGTTQSLVSVGDLQEFRIATSTYSAEFGRSPGGQISFLTRSGTSEWHGSAFDYFRNSALDANNWFNNNAGLPKTAERQNDFGGTLGGPIAIPGFHPKDKTFFFVSYEGLRLRIPQPAVTFDVPDTYLRQNAPSALQPLLNAFPVPNQPEAANNCPAGSCLALFKGAYSSPASLDAGSIRIDHKFGERLTIFGRYSDSPSETATRSSTNLANLIAQSFDVKTLTLGATDFLSSRYSNDFRFNYTWNHGRSAYSLDNFGGAQPISPSQLFSVPLPASYNFGTILYFGTLPGFNVSPFRTRQDQLNLVDSASASYGAHIIKLGVDFRRLTTFVYGNQLQDALYFFSPTDVLTNSASLAFVQTFDVTEPIFTNLSAYIQDEWRTTNRLHLSLGLRWEWNPPPGNGAGRGPFTLNQVTNLETAQLAPAGTALWKADYHAFAPRLGIAYQIHESQGRETVLRAGVGLFYDTGNTQGALGLGAVGFSSNRLLSGVGFPLTPAQNRLPPPSTDSPYNTYVVAFAPDLTLPSTLQWNVSLEQALGARQSLTVGYVGASGRDLLYSRYLTPNNPNLTPNGLYLVTNGAVSNYNALQVQFQRRLSRGLQILTSYTWSHSIDDLSSNFSSYEPPIRGNSDFDVRHSFAAALTWEIPGSYRSSVASAILEHWALAARITGRSALPVDVFGGFGVLPNGTNVYIRPDMVSGAPLYLYGAQCAEIPGATCPGGRTINFNAFATPSGESGNEPRNFLRGFDLWQTDLAIQRDFPLHERLKLAFRAEAFNLFNRANFGNIQNNLGAGQALFGQATGTLNTQLGGLNPLYQLGGPRSLQLVLRVVF